MGHQASLVGQYPPQAGPDNSLCIESRSRNPQGVPQIQTGGQNVIRAGKKSEINWESGEWVILDIGFSSKARSCGLTFNESAPRQVRYDEAVDEICSFITESKRSVNLIIEAPLSVAFNRNGNPTGRSCEKQGRRARYWYIGPGCTTMVAALYLVRRIQELSTDVEVRLFEGFVSFKDRGAASSHVGDVELLREAVKEPLEYTGSIIGPEELRCNESDTLQSAFRVVGIDTGVPPVIVRSVD